MLLNDFVIPSAPTKLCISLAKRPGIFGTTVHNAGYAALKLDYLYKAFATNDVVTSLSQIKNLGIRGCSISMPFKETVLNYLDNVEPLANEIGAVNTIVNDQGILKGYNTDIYGVLTALSPYLTKKNEKIMVLGGGGMARAILKALHVLDQKNITVYLRKPKQYLRLTEGFDVKLSDWSLRHDPEATVLINATPIGMVPDTNQSPVEIQRLQSMKLIMDVIVTPKVTSLIKNAQLHHLKVIDGLTVALNQAYEQFYLYTGILAPREEMYQAALTI